MLNRLCVKLNAQGLIDLKIYGIAFLMLPSIDRAQRVVFAAAKGSFGLWIQPVDATDWLNRSAGVS